MERIEIYIVIIVIVVILILSSIKAHKRYIFLNKYLKDRAKYYNESVEQMGNKEKEFTVDVQDLKYRSNKVEKYLNEIGIKGEVIEVMDNLHRQPVPMQVLSNLLLVTFDPMLGDLFSKGQEYIERGSFKYRDLRWKYINPIDWIFSILKIPEKILSLENTNNIILVLIRAIWALILGVLSSYIYSTLVKLGWL